MRTLMRIVGGTTVIAGATVLAMAPALADPPSGVKPKETDIVSVGSDTDEFLVDQLAFDYNKAHKSGPRVYSWDAVNPKTGQTENITTKSGCSPILRPNGASAGITAFDNNAKTADHKQFCIDFVRSARGRSSTDPGKSLILFVTLAKDAISYATNATSNAPANLSKAQLNAIYSCTDTTWNQVGGKGTSTIQPFLPQTGSGLRTSFLKAIGLDVAGPGSCVNSSVQQNEGTDPQFKNNPNALVPYSVAKWISQKFHSAKCGVKPTATQNRFGCDEHGQFVLHSINGTKPTTGTGTKTTINSHYTPGFMNVIYDVVRTAKTKNGIPTRLQPIFDSVRRSGSGPVSGWACASLTAKKDLANYGFLPTPFCGSGS
jgi:ABC-type phosphate transport system substrate-binding protein